MNGWDYYVYESQPIWFIDQLFAKWKMDSDKEEREGKQREIENSSRLKK